MEWAESLTSTTECEHKNNKKEFDKAGHRQSQLKYSALCVDNTGLVDQNPAPRSSIPYWSTTILLRASTRYKLVDNNPAPHVDLPVLVDNNPAQRVDCLKSVDNNPAPHVDYPALVDQNPTNFFRHRPIKFNMHVIIVANSQVQRKIFFFGLFWFRGVEIIIYLHSLRIGNSGRANLPGTLLSLIKLY